jgi:hypothetical protein
MLPFFNFFWGRGKEVEKRSLSNAEKLKINITTL